MISIDWRRQFLVLFVLLGPWGTLLTPNFLPKPFRFYYFLLPFFPFLWTQTKVIFFRISLFLAPFFLYSLFSALLAKGLEVGLDEDPFFRFSLLFSHICFALGLASQIENVKELKILIFWYLQSFFYVLLIGYSFFIGYYLDWVPLEILERFSILTQFGYGILRFSPGSYPNEFGIVCSFILSCLFSALSFARGEKNFLPKMLKRFSYLYIFLAFGALILTTTRSAYLSFFFCFFWLAKRLIPRFFLLFCTSLAIIWAIWDLSLYAILRMSLEHKMNEGSLGERYFVWKEAFSIFQDAPFFGSGFGAFSQLHNVYLALLFELGVLGIFVLALSLFGIWICHRERPSWEIMSKEAAFVRQVKNIGLVHVLWFAASNHNLNHHLTWFVFFLYFSLLSLKNALAVKASEEARF